MPFLSWFCVSFFYKSNTVIIIPLKHRHITISYREFYQRKNLTKLETKKGINCERRNNGSQIIKLFQKN